MLCLYIFVRLLYRIDAGTSLNYHGLYISQIDETRVHRRATYFCKLSGLRKRDVKCFTLYRWSMNPTN